MSLPFFEAMVDAAVTEREGAAWGRILTLGLQELGKPDTQLKDVHQLQPAIQLLGALTTPSKLQRCLVSERHDARRAHALPPRLASVTGTPPLILWRRASTRFCCVVGPCVAVLLRVTGGLRTVWQRFSF